MCRVAGASIFGTSTRGNNCGIFTFASIASILYARGSTEDSEPFERLIANGNARLFRDRFACMQSEKGRATPEHDMFLSYDELRDIFVPLFPELFGRLDAKMAQISYLGSEERDNLLDQVASYSNDKQARSHLSDYQGPEWQHLGWRLHDEQGGVCALQAPVPLMKSRILES